MEIRITFANGLAMRAAEYSHDGDHLLAVRTLHAMFPGCTSLDFRLFMEQHLGSGLRFGHVLRAVVEANAARNGITPGPGVRLPPTFVTVVIDEAHVLLPSYGDKEPEEKDKPS